MNLCNSGHRITSLTPPGPPDGHRAAWCLSRDTTQFHMEPVRPWIPEQTSISCCSSNKGGQALLHISRIKATAAVLRSGQTVPRETPMPLLLLAMQGLLAWAPSAAALSHLASAGSHSSVFLWKAAILHAAQPPTSAAPHSTRLGLPAQQPQTYLNTVVSHNTHSSGAKFPEATDKAGHLYMPTTAKSSIAWVGGKCKHAMYPTATSLHCPSCP